MKRIITFIIAIFLVFFIFQFTMNLFKTNHKIEYKFKSDELEFNVKEIYDKEIGYYVEIKNKDNIFMFNNINNYNKQRKIIKDIKYINEAGTFCVLPIYKKDYDNDIQCIKNNESYTYQSLNNETVLKFIKTLKKDNINLNSLKTNNELTDESGIKVYNNNILKNDYITVWNYKGISIISKNKFSKVNVLDYDNYDNKLGVLVNNNYIVPNYNEKYEYTTYFNINILNNAKKTITLNNKIDVDCYNNGVVDNKLYIFDKSNKIQYSLDQNGKSLRIVGNSDINAQYYDGKWNTRNIYDFINSELTFKKTLKDKLDFNYKDIFESNSAYYFYDNNGNFYKVFKNNLKTKILLFNNTKATNIKMIKDTIYYLDNDTIYYYKDGYGIKPVIVNNEFRFNNKNIYDVYKK